MVETLIVLNNYFHDLAVSLVFVTATAMFLLERYASRYALSAGNSGAEFNGLALFVVSRLNAVFWGSVLYVVAGGVSRVWNMSEFEWADALRNGQIVAFKAKYTLLFTLFFYGIYLWLIAHRKLKAMRKEMKNQ